MVLLHAWIPFFFYCVSITSFSFIVFSFLPCIKSVFLSLKGMSSLYNKRCTSHHACITWIFIHKVKRRESITDSLFYFRDWDSMQRKKYNQFTFYFRNWDHMWRKYNQFTFYFRDWDHMQYLGYCMDCNSFEWLGFKVKKLTFNLNL